MRFVALACLLGLGCKQHAIPPEADKAPVTDPCKQAKLEGTMAWIADDYPAALACARARKVPLVLDLWAPWCHTCLSMQSTVFTDPSFAADRDRFVFASLDTDREGNAAPLAKLAISAWPTFYVIGSDEAVLARFVGGASVAQFHGFLDAAIKAVKGGAAGADARLLGAERALAIKDLATADEELTAALAAAPAAWPRRPEVLDSLILTKAKRKDLDGCLTVMELHGNETGNAASASDFLGTAMGCATDWLAATPAQAARVKTLREAAIAKWRQLIDDKATAMSVDDTSDAMASARETLEALGDKARARELAERQRGVLDAAAAAAKTPMAAMTYNWPRSEVYVYLGKPLELVPALERSAKDLPGEYDPRARLGWILLKAGKLDDAAKWTDEALRLVYGPRKGRLLIQRADIASAAGDKVTERKFRALAVKQYEGLPAGQQSPDALAKARAALVEAEAGSATQK